LDFTDIPRHPDLITGRVRIETFIDKGWDNSSPVSINELLGDGFYYTGITDEIECYYCSLRIRVRDKGEDLHIAHEQFSPNCYLIKLKKNYNIFQNDSNYVRISGRLEF
jgi:hypothetical protein